MKNKNLNEVFEKEFIENISNIIEDKMHVLKDDRNFKHLDNNLLTKIEDFESLMSEELKLKFNDIMRLIYQTEEYYFSLAYLLGIKYGNGINNI